MKYNHITFFLNFKKLWQESIHSYFLDKMIVNERNLQAELYHQLTSFQGYDVFVQPKLEIENSSVHQKEVGLIVAKDNEILAVIEVKYNTNNITEIIPQIETLKQFSKLPPNMQVALKVDIDTGLLDKTNTYSTSTDILYILAVIGWKDRQILEMKTWPDEVKKILPDNFYHFAGIISEGKSDFQVKSNKTLPKG